MSTRSLRKRVERVAKRVRPALDGHYTWEEFCRMTWQQGKAKYLKMVDKGNYALGHWIPQFEREDAERRARSKSTRVKW